MKIVFSSNISWSIYNFRKGLLQSLQNNGHEIFTVAAKDDYSQKLTDLGFNFSHIDINNNSKNPIEDIKLVLQYYKIYKRIKPNVICHNAIKPNIYGTIAAGLLGIPVVNNISGLGTLFIKQSISTKIAKILYRISQRNATKVFFQNQDDLELFINSKLIREDKCIIIPGSGVDTNKFRPVKREKKKEDGFRFLFVGRLIYDKGIREYIEAAKIIKEEFTEVQFDILGGIYQKNETAIKKEELNAWSKMGIINYLGESDSVHLEMEKADSIVLPSYREGLSKVLIEASSMGIPIVTTDVPGCRDVVVNNITGFLAEVKSVNSLYSQMKRMILLSQEDRIKMGTKARERAVEVFDEKIIIKHYKDVICSIT